MLHYNCFDWYCLWHFHLLLLLLLLLLFSNVSTLSFNVIYCSVVYAIAFLYSAIIGTWSLMHVCFFIFLSHVHLPNFLYFQVMKCDTILQIEEKREGIAQIQMPTLNWYTLRIPFMTDENLKNSFSFPYLWNVLLCARHVFCGSGLAPATFAASQFSK